MERASRVSGTVLGPESDQYPELLSWAVIDLESENFTFNTFSLDGTIHFGFHPAHTAWVYISPDMQPTPPDSKCPMVPI